MSFLFCGFGGVVKSMTCFLFCGFGGGVMSITSFDVDDTMRGVHGDVYFDIHGDSGVHIMSITLEVYSRNQPAL